MTVTGSVPPAGGAGGEGARSSCGAFQGSRRLFDLNRRPFGLEPSQVEPPRSWLTHAHPDSTRHGSRRPSPAGGFQGADPAPGGATRELCEHLLLDASKLQREDAKRDRRHGRSADDTLFHDGLRRAHPLARSACGWPTRRPRTSRASAGRPGRRAHPRIGEASSWRRALGASSSSGDVGNARNKALPDPSPCPEADLVVNWRAPTVTATTAPTRP